MKTGHYQIPFDVNGNQLDYDDRAWNKTITMVDNFEFDDVLTLVGSSRGRSSVGFNMRRQNGKTVNVFLSNFVEMCHHMINGVVVGRFTFVKKGANFGCRMIL